MCENPSQNNFKYFSAFDIEKDPSIDEVSLAEILLRQTYYYFPLLTQLFQLCLKIKKSNSKNTIEKDCLLDSFPKLFDIDSLTPYIDFPVLTSAKEKKDYNELTAFINEYFHTSIKLLNDIEFKSDNYSSIMSQTFIGNGLKELEQLNDGIIDVLNHNRIYRPILSIRLS